MRLKNIIVLLVILLALGGFLYFTRASESPPQNEPQVLAWDIEMTEILHIEIRLPREDKREAFIRINEGEKFPWFFDDLQRSPVDMERWGGGIPLILSGPSAKRVIARDTTAEKLAEFGLTQPQMEITLTLENGSILNIKVGDRTPDSNNFYVQIPNSNDICLVDYTWHEVLERLIRDPPYATKDGQ